MRRLTHGKVQFVTRLLKRAQAERFAQCLRANRRFVGVEVEVSGRTRHPDRRWRVAYGPANADRLLALLALQIDDRLERARREGPDYVWRADEDFVSWRVLTCSGAVYEVDTAGRSCSCRDHQLRCAPAALRCKHLLALDLHLGSYYSAFQAASPAQARVRDPEGCRSVRTRC